MKQRPTIDCAAQKITLRDTTADGKFIKNKLSIIFPYKAETGRLTFSPSPVRKTAIVKAGGGGQMWILNTADFRGKGNITFNGMSIPEDYKGNYRISASTYISVLTPEYTYTCVPNVHRK